MIEIAKKKLITLDDEIRVNGKRIGEVWVNNKKVYPDFSGEGNFVKFRGKLKKTFSYYYPYTTKYLGAAAGQPYMEEFLPFNSNFIVDLRFVIISIPDKYTGQRSNFSIQKKIQVPIANYWLPRTYPNYGIDIPWIPSTGFSINLAQAYDWHTEYVSGIRLLDSTPLSTANYQAYVKATVKGNMEERVVNYLMYGVSYQGAKEYSLKITDNDPYNSINGTAFFFDDFYGSTPNINDSWIAGLTRGHLSSNNTFDYLYFYIYTKVPVLLFNRISYTGSSIDDYLTSATTAIVPISIPITEILYIGDYDKAPKKMRTLRESDLDF